MKILRFGVCALLAFMVLAHGGVEEWAYAVFETGTALLLVYWAVLFFRRNDEQVVIPTLLPPLFVFTCVVLFQYLLHTTASAFATRQQLQLLAADLVFLFLAAQAFRTIEEWRSFFWFLLFFGFVISGFGILQHLTFNGKLYWFREMRYGGIPFGPYVNRNHFAGFAELIIPVALVPLVLGKVRQERRFVVGLFAIVSIGALLLSASRGGIISFAAEIILLFLFLLLRRGPKQHLFVGGIVLVAAVLMVSWLGVSQILGRFSSLQTLEVNESKRASMREGSWRIFLDHPVIGTGLGTLQLVYPPYETLYDGKIVNHSHNDYLEALAETGLLGGLCCAWFLAVLYFDGLRLLQSAIQSFTGSLRLVGLLGCTGLLVHSFVDFNIHIPANFLLFILMALLATSEIRNPDPPPVEVRHRRRRSRKP